jgi:hypothetical protein
MRSASGGRKWNIRPIPAQEKGLAETTNSTEDIWWILERKDYLRLWWELIPQN